MCLPDEVYDALKWALIDVPTPLIALFTAIGQLANVDMTVPIGVISAVSIFFIAVLLESNFVYKKGDAEE